MTTTKSPAALGTIFANARQIQAADDFCDKQAASTDKLARSTLNDCARHVVNGETRYYKTATRYAIMSRANIVRWFDVRGNQTFAAK